MTTEIIMTEKTIDQIIPTRERRFFLKPKPAKCDADYIKARERLRAVLSLLSALVDEHDTDSERTWGHVGDLNRYAEVLEGVLCLGETVDGEVIG